MKSILIILMSVLSLSALASTYDGDVDEVYRSWCEQENVMKFNSEGRQAVLQNCAVSEQVCQLDQRTSGKRVIYTASCVDRHVPYARD